MCVYVCVENETGASLEAEEKQKKKICQQTFGVR